MGNVSWIHEKAVLRQLSDEWIHEVNIAKLTRKLPIERGKLPLLSADFDIGYLPDKARASCNTLLNLSMSGAISSSNSYLLMFL